MSSRSKDTPIRMLRLLCCALLLQAGYVQSVEAADPSLEAMLERVAVDRTVVVAVTNFGYLDYTVNLWKSMKTLGLHGRYCALAAYALCMCVCAECVPRSL